MSQAGAKGWIAPASIIQVGRVGLAVAVKEGAPAPDVATVDAFKKTLLAAKSIVYVDPTRGSSGKYFASVLEKLGIAAEMKPKTKIMAGGYVAELVAKGEAELAVHLVTEILPVKGIKIVGLFPPELQKFIVYQAAATAKTGDAAAAKAFLDNLATPEMRALAVKKGFVN
jgi:molybdate transport system substrate-binding protein